MLDLKLKFTPSHASARDWMAPSPLKKLFWNVTRACNFRCGICFTNSGGAAADGELTTEEALAAVDAAAAAGVGDIIISGGEPFLRPDIERILERMAERDITARIATNGSRQDDDLLRRLKRRTRVKSFQISVDSLDPQVYDLIHGVPVRFLETALDAMERIGRHGFHATASARVTPRRCPVFPPCCGKRTIAGGPRSPCTCRCRRVAPKASSRRRRICWSSSRPCWKNSYIPWAEYHPAIRRLSDRVPFVHCGCRAGRDRLTLGLDGALTFCVCLDVPEAVVGNIRTDDLRRVFADAPLCRLYRDPIGEGICADCRHADRCGGGCRASAWSATGSFHAPDPGCPLLRHPAASCAPAR